MHRSRIVVPLAAALLLTACQTKAPSQMVFRQAGQGQYTTLSGVAQATSTLLANNSGALVANNSSTLIQNNGSNFRVQATDDAVPVANAKVVLTDSFGQPVPGVQPVSTDAQGHFTLTHVPAGFSRVVEVQAPGFHLATLVSTSLAAKAVEVSPATTLATEHLRQSFGSEKGALARVSSDRFNALLDTVKSALAGDDKDLDLSSPDAAAKGFDKLAAKHAEVAKGGESAVKATQDDILAAVEKGDVKESDLANPATEAAEVSAATAAANNAPTTSSSAVPSSAPGSDPATASQTAKNPSSPGNSGTSTAGSSTTAGSASSGHGDASAGAGSSGSTGTGSGKK